ncbi:MAG TPA: ribonuclease P protein component [Aquabacterium sp.]|nr:ribonuclease P protein component [Aquabacterium sp.]HQC99482.1 ribonuclease P protein component [Aquabacterium sp.]
MVGRILRSADFQRVLGTPPRSRSAHFAAHHVAAWPSVPAKPRAKAAAPELSTGDAPSCPPVVDESHDGPPQPPLQGRWLGMVVPKKHARRAVTRNLIKRQMRALMDSAGAGLPDGLWVLRLKAPFDRKVYTSPASAQLLQAARDELQLLLQRALAPRR